jgi:hypothetical protein
MPHFLVWTFLKTHAENALVVKHFLSPDHPQHEKYQTKGLLIPSARKT